MNPQIQFYQKTLEWIFKERENQPKKPIIIGVNGAQGIGKTTLCRYLVDALNAKNIKAISISIDDFYFTRKQQIELAKANPKNPYLQQRGYPGTHDVALGAKVLQSLVEAQTTEVPIYDKAAYSGLGDRSEKCQKLDAPEVVLLEGWMLGFTPVKKIEDTHLNEINEALKKYEAWTKFLNAFLILMPEKTEHVLTWRVEAEKTGMPLQDIRKYIEKFLPAYALYQPFLRQNDPVPDHTLRFEIGFDRLPKD